MFQSLRYLFVGLSLQYVLNWCAFLKSSMEKVLSSDFKCDAFWNFFYLLTELPEKWVPADRPAEVSPRADRAA